MAIVSALWRYPVKSMAGESVEALDIDARGVVGDRELAVITEAGAIASGKSTRRFERVDGLIACAAARQSGGEVIVTLPDGSRHGAADAAALSAWLGRPLRYAAEAEVSHFDAAGLHIVSTATVAWLEQASGVACDARRLRPNLVVDAGPDPHVEERWIGGELSIGAARLRVIRGAERCVMTTFAQGTLPASPAVLRAIAGREGTLLGVYAEVVTGGRVRVGDAVEQPR